MKNALFVTLFICSSAFAANQSNSKLSLASANQINYCKDVVNEIEIGQTCLTSGILSGGRRRVLIAELAGLPSPKIHFTPTTLKRVYNTQLAELGWLDESSGITYLDFTPQKGVNVRIDQSMASRFCDSKVGRILPPVEAFIELERHGLREVLNIQGYNFWSSHELNHISYPSGIFENFDGTSGRVSANYEDGRESPAESALCIVK